MFVRLPNALEMSSHFRKRFLKGMFEGILRFDQHLLHKMDFLNYKNLDYLLPEAATLC